MRKLDFKNDKNRFENDLKEGLLKPIVDYVKSNDDVFLGIRKREVILYSAGAKILDITKNDNGLGYNFSFDKNHYPKINDIPKEINQLPTIVEKENDVLKWKSQLNKIKEACVKFNYNHPTKRTKKNGEIVYSSNKEKIIQQAFLEKMNNDLSDYFCYDIEYVFDNNKIKIPFGRIDNMVISIPKDDAIKLYLYEFKNKSGAISGVEATTNGEIKSWGSGVVGHVYNYMKLLDLIYDNENKIVYEHFRDELKYAMNLYKSLELIKNEKFNKITEEEWNNINKIDVEVVFYMTNQNSEESFFNHLGIGERNSNYNVKDFLKNKKKALSGSIYNFRLRNFKYWIDTEKFDLIYKNNDVVKKHEFNIDVESYDEIESERLK